MNRVQLLAMGRQHGEKRNERMLWVCLQEGASGQSFRTNNSPEAGSAPILWTRWRDRRLPA